MHQRTSHVTLNASREATFGFLADIQNLPRWAIHFCHELHRDGEQYKATTPQGEIYVRIEADAATGVVDFLCGPSLDHMLVYPTRVVALQDDRAMYLFTSIQYPGIDNETFAAMCDSLGEEFEQLRRQVETGSGARV